MMHLHIAIVAIIMATRQLLYKELTTVNMFQWEMAVALVVARAT
jgi:hypothetical protein